MTTDSPSCGIVIMCAKGDEQRVIVSAIEQDPIFKLKRTRKQHLPTYSYTTPEGVVETLVVASTGMGNINAASRTGFMLGTYEPNLILFVGTAGSLAPDDCCIGDVVIPEMGAVSLMYNKIVDEEAKDKFTGWRNIKSAADLWPRGIDGVEYALRPVTEQTTLSLTPQSKQSIADARKVTPSQPDLQLLLTAKSEDTRPKLHFDKQIFSWEKVIASRKYREKVTTQFPSAIAVDMESYGFLLASKQFQEVGMPLRAVVVRGISDLCDPEKSNSHASGKNDIAVENATIVALELIKRHYLTT